MTVNRPFSLLMSVYAGEKPHALSEALASICVSDEIPAEVVLVEDGPISDSLKEVIEAYRIKLPLRTLRLESNQGLAGALNVGLEACSHELVARFDSDDICLPQRFTEQLNFLLMHPAVSAVSSWVREFDGATGNNLGMRAPPVTHHELKRFAKLRNPLNHPAVMYRRSAVKSVGGYQDEVGFEDYSLWIRMIMRGDVLANLPHVLVRMRAGSDQLRRRSGWRYAMHELHFAGKFRRQGYFSWREYTLFVVLRVPLRVLADSVIQQVYRRFGRTLPR